MCFRPTPHGHWLELNKNINFRKNRKNPTSASPIIQRRLKRRSLHPQPVRPLTMIVEKEVENTMKIRARSKTVKEASRHKFSKQNSIV